MKFPAAWLTGISTSILRRRAPFSARMTLQGAQSLHVVLSGEVTLTRSDSRVAAKAGELVLLRATAQAAGASMDSTLLYESVVTSRPEEVIVVSVALPEEASASRPTTRVVHLECDRVAADPALGSLVHLLTREVTSAGTDQRVLANLMDVLSTYVLRQLAPGACSNDAPMRDRRIVCALELIQSRPGERWTLRTLAKASGLSRSAFTRRFRRAVGVPPLRYLTEWRVRVASELLLQTDDCLAAIASLVGYESEFAFSRAFKRHIGQAPGAFRRQALRSPSVTLALAA